jgi:hypothetical protein
MRKENIPQLSGKSLKILEKVIQEAQLMYLYLKINLEIKSMDMM